MTTLQPRKWIIAILLLIPSSILYLMLAIVHRHQSVNAILFSLLFVAVYFLASFFILYFLLKIKISEEAIVQKQLICPSEFLLTDRILYYKGPFVYALRVPHRREMIFLPKKFWVKNPDMVQAVLDKAENGGGTLKFWKDCLSLHE